MGITTIGNSSLDNEINTTTETPEQKIAETMKTEKTQLDDTLQSDVDVHGIHTFDQSKHEFERFVNNNNTVKVIQWLDAMFQKVNSEEEKTQAKTYFLGCIATGILNNKQDIKKFLEHYPDILGNNENIYSQKGIFRSGESIRDTETQVFLSKLKKYKIGLFGKVKQIFRHKKNFNIERAKIILEDFPKFYTVKKAEKIESNKDTKDLGKEKSWRGKNNKKESRRKISKSKTSRGPKSDNTQNESWRGQNNKKVA